MANEEKAKKINKEEESRLLQAEHQRIQEKMDKEVTFKTMPERFLKGAPQSAGNKSKVVGAVIIFSGVALIIASGVLLYMYLVKPMIIKPVIVVESTNQGQVTDVNETTEEPVAIEEEPEEVTTPTATTTQEIPAVATTTEETATTTSPEETTEVVLAQDADMDGLSSLEEILLGTSDNSVDSDNDTYGDLMEINNSFDPASGNGSRLIDNVNLKEYVNSTYGYSVIVPNAWIFNRIGDDSVLFRAGDDQFFQIIAQTNVDKEDIITWYKKQFDIMTVPSERILKTDEWQGVWSGNKTVVYLTDKKLEDIYVISYTPLNEADLSYANIFNLLVNTFVK